MPSNTIIRRYKYTQAFITSPKLKLKLIEINRISDGIAILGALGEGRLLVSTRKRRPNDGYFNMVECRIDELENKTEAEIYTLLDRRMERVLEAESRQTNRGLNSGKICP